MSRPPQFVLRTIEFSLPVTKDLLAGQIGMKRRSRAASAAGVTLLELFCAIAIICILVSLLLPVCARAYRLAKGMAQEDEAPRVASLLRHEARNYCTANPQFLFEGKTEFIEKCQLAPKCREWVELTTTDFVPFGYLDPTNEIVLTVRLGPKQNTIYSFTKGDLSIRVLRP